MSDLHITFQNALKHFGPPTNVTPIPTDTLLAYEGKLPAALLEFWKQYGFGMWMKGYFQFCDPSIYGGVLEMILENDSDLKPSRSYVIGFSAFGHLLVWNEDYRIVQVDTLRHGVSCAKLFKPGFVVDENGTVGIAVGNVDSEANDPSDEDGKPLFKRVLKACGPLEFGQIYALKLHPALGGSIVLENFRPANALAALAIAAQTGPFTLYNTTIPKVPPVREIGS